MKKKYKFQILLLLLLAIVFLTTSCYKQKDKDYVTPKTDDNFSLLGVIERYYKVANTKVDGKFMFESNLCNNDPSLTNISLAGGIFYDRSGNPETGGGLVSIGDNKWMPNSQGTYGFDKALPQKGLFGQDITFTLTPPSQTTSAGRNTRSAGTNTVTTTLYPPEAITITNVPPQTSITLVPNQNTALTWNADPYDSNGVIIIGEYLPSRYVNKSALSAGNSYLVESSMLVPDNGSTSIPWSFFSNFPGNGHIILWIARGNYSIIKGIYNYQVGGYTAAAVCDVTVPTPPDVPIYAEDDHGTDITIQLHNVASGQDYSFTVYAHDSGILGDVPPGTYNITLTPNSSGWYNYSVGCGYSDAGPGAMTFSGVDINSSCNSITIE